MALMLDMVTVDSPDPMPLARWWAEQLGGRCTENADEGFALVHLASGLIVGFQHIDEPTPGKNRIHFDLHSPDRSGDVERLAAAGAAMISEHTDGDYSWTVLADPQGNLFCVGDRPDAEGPSPVC